MIDRLKQIPVQLLKQWNKYTSKQKTIIISVVAFVFLSLIILVNVMNRTKYETLIVSEDKKDVSAVAELLKAEGIDYKLGSDELTILVDARKRSDALLLLYSSDIPTSGLTLETLLDNGIDTTNSDRNLKLHMYIQSDIVKALKDMKGIEGAQVDYVPVDNTFSVLSEKQDYPVSVKLNVTKDFEPSKAEGIAEYVAAAIGNKSTDNVKVLDQEGNLLFGGKEDLYSGSASSVQDYRERLENNYNNNIIMLLMKLDYTDVQPMFNWSLNMDKVTQMFEEQIPAEGQEQGLYKNYYSYDTQNTSGSSGGTPGTQSNDDVGYNIENPANNNSSSSTLEIEYLPSKRVTNTAYEIGAVRPEQSSGSLVLIRSVTHNEDELKLQGALDNMSFDEYRLANQARQPITVEPEVYTLISRATGIPEENISIMAYEQPVFVPSTKDGPGWTFYLQLVLVVLMIALLLFVVFRGTAPMEITELEPELSVEQLLATTKENQSLDDIEFSEQSETKKMIDKFVDENPEAVAQLLRNWLNDEWN